MLAVLILTTSCQNEPIKVRGQILAAADINPNVRNKASPVEIRIYWLSDNKKFEAANYLTLIQSDTQVLGKDMLHKEVMIVRPGQTLPYRVDINKDTVYLAAIAAFRDTRTAQWKAVHRISVFRHENVRIKLEQNSVSFTGFHDTGFHDGS